MAATEAADAALQRILEVQRPALTAAAAAHPAAWLAPALATDAGTIELYGLLEERAAGPAFVARLEAARAAGPPPPPAGDDVLTPEWWAEPAVAGPPPPHPASSSPLDGAPYVFIDKADVVDAVASFLAAYLATLPEAGALSAPDLAAALAGTLRELKKGKAARLWGWGKALYRAAAVASGAFGAYSHPWLARAVVAGVWSGARALAGLW